MQTDVDELPLPAGWQVEMFQDKVLYVNHESKSFSWVHPSKISEQAPGDAAELALHGSNASLPAAAAPSTSPPPSLGGGGEHFGVAGRGDMRRDAVRGGPLQPLQADDEAYDGMEGVGGGEATAWDGRYAAEGDERRLGDVVPRMDELGGRASFAQVVGLGFRV